MIIGFICIFTYLLDRHTVFFPTWHISYFSFLYFFVNNLSQFGKGLNLYWVDINSFTFTSSKRQVIGNIFILSESEKGWKKTPEVPFSLLSKLKKEIKVRFKSFFVFNKARKIRRKSMLCGQVILWINLHH